MKTKVGVGYKSRKELEPRRSQQYLNSSTAGSSLGSQMLLLSVFIHSSACAL